MQWLTSILAFATTMLVFSMVVSAIVEMYHRVLSKRSSGLRRMLEHYYEQVLSPQLREAGIQLDQEEFLQTMTQLRAPSAAPDAARGKTKVRGCIRRYFGLLNNLPTEAFMERLGTTSFSAIVDKGSEEEREQLLKDIAQKYEIFGAESSLSFEGWARLKSVLLAMVIAWAFYVHPYDVLQTYFKDPVTAAKVAALAEEKLGKYEDFANFVEQAKVEQAEQGDGDVDAADDQATSENVESLLARLEEEIETGKTEVETLKMAGAPVGWPTDKTRFGKKAVLGLFDVYYPKQLRDLFWLVIGGLLIGLGAPFWAQTVRQLTQVQSVAKNVSNILQPPSQPPSQPQPGTPAGAESPPKPLTSDAFLMSAKAKRGVLPKQ